jgi:hypothetical protein
LFGGDGVVPGGGVVGADGVDLGESNVRVGEGGVEPDGLQQQAESFVLAVGDAVKLGEVEVWARIFGLALDPRALLLHLGACFLIEGEVDYFFAPEAHG